MSQVWFTADTHFGHGNIIKFCNRPFLSEEEQALSKTDPRGSWRVSQQTIRRHDNAILDAINALVGPKDQLWILGDFCWGKYPEAERYLRRITCKKVNLVWGNHDNRSIGDLFHREIEQGMINVEGQRIWLNHYPMRSWDGRFHGSWHLYGHVHDRMSEEDRQSPELLTKDVGVDACDYQPISFSQLKMYMKPRIERFEQAKAAFIDGKGPSID